MSRFSRHTGQLLIGSVAMAVSVMVSSCTISPVAEDEIVSLLAEDAPYHVVSPQLFDDLGWELPDGGVAVRRLADGAPGSAFDPRKLESIDATTLGYSARWHEVRFSAYDVDWDISGLHLVPAVADGSLPTVVIINGGAANWYEFFIGPKNDPGLAQYLAQRVPVLLITIPGNYRHGGWPDMDFGRRIPAYLLDQDISETEAAARNAAFTFRVIADGVERIVRNVIDGPVVMIGHSTGGEIQFMLKERLSDKLRGLSMGWGTGGPAGLQSMRSFRGTRSIDDFQHVSENRARTPDQYSGGYLGPLNPFWNEEKSPEQIANEWMGAEARRRPQFKQPLQDIEHTSAINITPELSAQIRETLDGSSLGIDSDEVIGDLFSTMRSPISGYEKMIWTTAKLDSGHWNNDLSKARELLIANEFRDANPDAAIRVLVFDVPMTHYGHVEKPRELAGGLLAALRWLIN